MWRCLPILVLTACPQPEIEPERERPPPTTTTTPPTTTPPTSGDLCENPPPVETWVDVPLEHVAEEFAFDLHGNIVTRSDAASSVVRTSFDGEIDIVVPYNSDEVGGVDFLLNGDFVIVDEARGSLVRVTSEGVVETLASGLYSPNSVAVRDDGMAYVNAFDTIMRVDPDTGEQEYVLSIPEKDLDGLTFSPDFKYLWFNADTTGDVYRVELDSGAEPEWIAALSMKTGHLDGAATDACGNVYIVRTDGKVTRIRAHDLQKESLLKVGRHEYYISSLHFGSGVGGWEEDHLYVINRSGGLFDLDIGIPGAPEPHLTQ